MVDWAPLPGQVADHLRAWTRTSYGHEQAEFTEETAIKLSEVQRCIDSVTAHVSAEVGRFADVHTPAMTACAAIGAAAMAVVNHDLELHERLEAMFTARLAQLSKLAWRWRTEQDGTRPSGAGLPASWCGPDSVSSGPEVF